MITDRAGMVELFGFRQFKKESALLGRKALCSFLAIGLTRWVLVVFQSFNLVLDPQFEALQLVYSQVIRVGVLHFIGEKGLKFLVPLGE
jgi:hypothetical protein